MRGVEVAAWALSLALHAGVLAAMYNVALRPETGRVAVIPEARLIEPGLVGPPREQQRLELAQEPLNEVQENRVRADPVEVAELVPRLDAPAAIDPVTDATPKSMPGSLVSVTGGARLATAIAGVAPVTTFFGLPGNAHKIVYVVEVSGSLMIYTDDIVRELSDSIRALKPNQSFHVILALPKQVKEWAPGRLVPANTEFKREALAFVDSIPRVPDSGQSDPVDAMKLAFAVHPELIYFLTDGDFYAGVPRKDTPTVTEIELLLENLNEDRAVQITTVAFDPAARTRDLLERIARRHRGNYRIVEPKL